MIIFYTSGRNFCKMFEEIYMDFISFDWFSGNFIPKKLFFKDSLAKTDTSPNKKLLKLIPIN